MNPLDAKKLELARLRAAARTALRYAFDGENLAAQPTPAQDAVLRDTDARVHWIVAANRSGKTQTGARIVAWWFLENHPHMTRPPEWRGQLQILVVGRLAEQMDSELWTKKIKPLLPPGSFREVKIGGTLQRVVNTRNGNRIIFLSHHDAENAREKVQAFTAHVVWLDEMPDHAGLVTELLARISTTNGRLYATFTPLIRNVEIHKIVEDRTNPYARRHQFRLLDNPMFRGKEAETEAFYRGICSSEAEFRARMFGDWYEGDQRVFRYAPDRNRVVVPPDYSDDGRHVWRHVAILDPAASGLAGLTVWAEHPLTGAWYCVKAEYLKGTAAYDLVDMVERELVGFHVTQRWCDCNPAGFYKEAARRRIAWTPYTDKNDRKVETIDKLNAAFLNQDIWLTDAAYRLEEELVKAEWSASSPDKIAAASSYHLCDTARYARDVFPPFNAERLVRRTESQEIRHLWKTRRAAEAQVRAKILQRRSKWSRPLRSRSSF